MSAVIKAAVAPYALYIKLGIFVAIAGVIGYQHWRIGSLKHDNTLLSAATSGYAQAQTTNLRTIGALQQALHDMVEVNRMDEARASVAASQYARDQKTIGDKLAVTQKELSNVYAHNANARTWGDTGVDAAVLAFLPKPAAANADQDRRETRSGTGSAAKDAGSH